MNQRDTQCALEGEHPYVHPELLGRLVLHNELLFRPTHEQAKKARVEWDKSPEPTDPKDPDLLDQKFWRTFRANSKVLLGNETQRITVASRLAGFATALGPVAQVREHLDAASKAPGPIPEPPFATAADFISRDGD